MKSETLKLILEALPDGAIQQIKDKTGKSKTTIYNVLKHQIHRNAAIVKAALEIIDTKAIHDIKLVAEAKRELAEDEKPKKNEPRQRQMKQAA